MSHPIPSMDEWLREAKLDPDAPMVGMYLTHNGVVRATPKKQVRVVSEEEAAQGASLGEVVSIDFSYDAQGLEDAIAEARTWPGRYRM